jgi:hypothetical protein
MLAPHQPFRKCPAGPLSPQALGDIPKSLRGSPRKRSTKQAHNNGRLGQTRQMHTHNQGRVVPILPVHSYYPDMCIHISSKKDPPSSSLREKSPSTETQHHQSFVRPSSLIPLLICGDVGLCGPTLTTLAAPRSAVAAVLMALTAT